MKIEQAWLHEIAPWQFKNVSTESSNTNKHINPTNAIQRIEGQPTTKKQKFAHFSGMVDNSA